MAYGIGEVAKRTGLRASAIRFYEEEGLLPPISRRSGRRIYGEEIFEHLTIIALAQAAGFSIAEMRRLKQGLDRRSAPGARWRALAGRKAAELEAKISAMQRMKGVLEMVMGCACPTMADCAEAARRIEVEKSGAVVQVGIDCAEGGC